VTIRSRVLLAASLAITAGAALAAPALVAADAFAVMPIPEDGRAQVNPAVAHDGKGTYLVVWQQGRLYHQSQSADILATRVDGRGRVLDRQPIVVCNAVSSQEQPQVAYSGGKFLVVWHDLRNGRDWDVYAARVNPDGTVLETNGFLVGGGPQNQASPFLAPADNGFLVAWQHYDRHYRLQASMVPTAGAPAPAQSLKFRGKSLWGGELALAPVGDGWLLSWNDETDWVKGDMITRHFARLAARNGKVEVLEVRRAPAVHVGRSGGRFASSGETAFYAGWGIVGRSKRAATGALFNSRGTSPIRNPNPEQQGQGSGWNTEKMMTLYSLGIPIDGPVAIAYGQGIYLAAAREAYSGKRADRNRLLGARLTTAGKRLDEAPAGTVLHDSPHRIANPALAGGSSHFLLAFEQEDAAGRRHIWAKILKVE
jgi:hypothetical protein